MKNTGEIIKYLRKSKNLSQEQLSDLIGCTREFISQIERNKCNLPDYLVLPLSNILTHDLTKLIKTIDEYEKLEHYILSYQLIELIEKKDNYNIFLLLKNEIISSEFNYGNPKVLKLYCTALIETAINNNIEASTEICLQQLDLNNLEEIYKFTPKLTNYYRYYSTILVLGCNLHLENKFELHRVLLARTLTFLNSTIINNVLPISSVDYFFKNFYITTLNNYSDVLFRLSQFEESFTFCEQALEFATTNNILFMLDSLLKLKIEILCNLNEIPQAKEVYLQFKYTCQLMRNNIYFEESTQIFKWKYPMLFI